MSKPMDESNDLEKNLTNDHVADGGAKAVESTDIEAGKKAAVGKGGSAAAPALYPKMQGDPALRWAFIRKVYSILAVQFLFTAGVAATFSLVRPIPRFLLSGSGVALGLHVVVLVLPLIVMWPMLHFRKRHPVNMVFLGLFTLCISFSIGWVCMMARGRIILEAAVLSAVVLIGLTLYTFWAARRGHDFNFLAPFLSASLLVLLTYLIIQIYFPLGRINLTIYGCLATIVFAGFIIWDTDNLIKRHEYDEYTSAAARIYLDVINLFMAIFAISAIDP